MLKQPWLGPDAVGLGESKYSAVSSADGCASPGTPWGVQWDQDVWRGSVLWARSHAMVRHAAATECVAHIRADLITLGEGDWKLPGVRFFH